MAKKMKRLIKLAALTALIVTIISIIPLSVVNAEVTKIHKMEFAIYAEGVGWVVGWMNGIHSEKETPKGLKTRDSFTAHSFIYAGDPGEGPEGEPLGRAVHTASIHGLETDPNYLREETIILKFKGLPAVHMKILIVVRNGDVKISIPP
jgi:hypothetical protein